jgi:MFS family permease
MGVFIDGFDLFIMAVALPLISADLNPSAATLGLIGAAALLGAVVGAAVIGRLSDRFGRKILYALDLAFFVVFSVLSALAWDVTSLIVFRFLLGVGVGADYPLSSAYISEFMPARVRGRMLVSGFSFQALGSLTGAAVGLLILLIYPEVDA